MREEARQKRAAEIEAAAYAVLEKKGYDGLSMLAVAKTAKASNETLYRWYGDKLGLFAALIERNTEGVRDVLQQTEGREAMTVLAVVGPKLLTMLLGARAVALNRAAAADGSGQLGRALGEVGRGTVGPWIGKVMARAIDEGALGQGTPREMAEVWFSLLIGDLQVRRVTGALGPVGAGEVEKRADGALERLKKLFPPT